LETVMIRCLALLLAFGFTDVPASAQLGQSGPSGDFRVHDRSGTAPTAGPAGGPSLPPGPAVFKDSLGGKLPDDILKELNRDLGRNSSDRSDALSGSHPLDLNRDTQAPFDKFFK
jgi:hypothetical protein